VTAPPPTVLVVEDEEMVRELAVELIEEFGYTVVAAENAAAALRTLAANHDVALLFTDIVMPGPLNGFALGREAKRRRPDLKVLYTSGYLARPDAREADEATGPLLAKPYRADQLRDALSAALLEK
jgi:CheY-like chemotaxis protein